MVIDFKRQQYEDLLELEGNLNNIDLFGDIPLILEKPVGEVLCGNSYNEIFGTGNSFESLFELYFASNQSRENKWVSNYFGSNSNTRGRLGVPDFLRQDVATGANTVFKKTDGRAYASTEMENQSYFIRKYLYQRVSFNTQNVNKEDDLKLSTSYRGSNNANWIFYRLTDAILMKAEALIQQGAENYEQAFSLINVVNKRANDVTTSSRADTLKMNDYIDSKASMEELLLAERQREFLFEGKRWFDLVRIARRDSSNTRLISLATRKYLENVNAIKIKLANPDIIYFPYAKSELKVNPLLKQNSAYANTEDSELTNK